MLTTLKSGRIVIYFLISSLFVVLRAEDIEQTDTFRLKVTYYDFHQDGSNPEFYYLGRIEAVPCTSGLAMPELDSERKLVPNRQVIQPGHNMNFLDRWFRPWVPGDTLIHIEPADTKYMAIVDSSTAETTITFWGTPTVKYKYYYDTVYLKPDTIKSDTLMKNAVIDTYFTMVKGPYKTLTFLGVDSSGRPLFDTILITGFLVGGAKSDFYPINGKGLPYGKDTINPVCSYGEKNGCFTMELHNRIRYKGGEILSFASDDDGWIYINNKVAIDMGGRHGPQEIEVKMDSLAPLLGLTPGGIYNFDLFFAERAPWNSACFLKTNLEFIDIEKVSGAPVVEPTNNDVEKGNTLNETEKESNSKKGLCGTGWIYAFLPAIGLKLKRLQKRKKSKSFFIEL